MSEEFSEHETLVRELNDAKLRGEYAKPLDDYQPGTIPEILGWLLVASGNLFYGNKPSYAKFKAVEIIARIPYQSWESAAYTLLTAFHQDEQYAIDLCRLSAFSRFAQDNETMHVVVISQIARENGATGFFRHTFIPVLFSFFYFWVTYLLYLISPKSALELNYLFESHAYAQYQNFLDTNGDQLRKNCVASDFLSFYGREAKSEYELFESIRNDELIHRNRSIREIEAKCSPTPHQ